MLFLHSLKALLCLGISWVYHPEPGRAAVIRNFEVMGEATKRLSQELRSDNSDIPWRQMAGFRDMLIHDYSKIDVGEVWAVIDQDLPMIKPRLVELLEHVK